MQFEGITLHAIISEIRSKLMNGFVQKIHQPWPDLLLLQIYAGEKEKLLISTSSDSRLHLTEQSYENPQTPSAFCMLLRKYCKNGQIEKIEQPGLERVADLWIRRKGLIYQLRVELFGNRSNVVLLKDSVILGALHSKRGNRPFITNSQYVPFEAQKRADPFTLRIEQLKEFFQSNNLENASKCLAKLLDGIGLRTAKELLLRSGVDAERIADSLAEAEMAALLDVIKDFFGSLQVDKLAPVLYYQDGTPSDCTHQPYQIYQKLESERFGSLSQALDAAHHGKEQEPVASKTQQLQKQVTAKLKKMTRARDQAISDLDKAGQFEVVRETGDLLMAQLRLVTKGQHEVELEDFSGQIRKIKLDPALSSTQNAQGYYERYKKLKRGVEKISERLALLTQELQHLENLQVQIDQAETLDELRELQAELELGEDLDAKRRKSAQPKANNSNTTGPRKIMTDGYIVYIGRNGRQNDALIREANREDLWFHAKDRPGAHVVLQTHGGQDVPRQILERAAELAAYYSRGRGSSSVPVVYTQIKHLKKPKGAKPGLVAVTKETGTLYVRPKGEE